MGGRGGCDCKVKDIEFILALNDLLSPEPHMVQGASPACWQAGVSACLLFEWVILYG